MGRKPKNGERPGFIIYNDTAKLIRELVRNPEDMGRLFRHMIEFALDGTEPEYGADDFILKAVFDNFAEKDLKSRESYSDTCNNRKVGVLAKKALDKRLNRQQFIEYMAEHGYSDTSAYESHLHKFKAEPVSQEPASEPETAQCNLTEDEKEWFRHLCSKFPLARQGTENHFDGQMVHELYDNPLYREKMEEAIDMYLETVSDPKYVMSAKRFFTEEKYIPYLDEMQRREFQ